MSEVLAAMRTPAYEIAGLSPAAFAATTPWDLADLIDAALERRWWWLEQIGSFVALLINATGRLTQPVTLDTVLGPAWTLRRIQRHEAETQETP